jgi:hypothetical protein
LENKLEVRPAKLAKLRKKGIEKSRKRGQAPFFDVQFTS